MQRQPLAPRHRERIVAGLPFVESLARRVAASMPHSIDLGDLVQDGMIGLIDAANRFDESRGIKFETFAERRVRGAMIDACGGTPGRAASAASAASWRPRASSCAASSAPSRRWRISPRASAPMKRGWAARSSASTRSSPRRRCRPGTTWMGRSCRPRSCRASRRSPTGRTRRPRVRDRIRVGDRVAPGARTPRDRPLLLRGSDDEADRRGDRRQRVARVAAARAGDPAAAEGARRRLRSSADAERAPSLAFERRRTRRQRPWRWPERHRCRQSAGTMRGSAERLRRRVQRDRLPRGPQQIASRKGFGEPAAAAVFQEPLRVGSGDVARHEDDAARQRRHRRRDVADRTPARRAAAS